MGTLNDEILRVTTGPTVNDGLKAFYLSRSAAGTTLPDLEASYLKLQAGVTPGPISDMWMQYLGLKSYSGTINDRQYTWWLNNAPL